MKIMEKIKRTDLQENIQEKIKSEISQYMHETSFKGTDINDSLIYNQFLNSGFLQITPPEEDPPMMQFLTMDSLKNYKQGKSIKPGNIRLNIRNLIESIPSAVEMAVGIAIDLPVLKICAALNLWKTIKGFFTVEISKEEAFVIVSLWKNCDSRHEISLEKGFISTNELLKKYEEQEFSNIKYNQVIDSLIKLQCIELTEGVIWLREWISKNYIDRI